MAIAVLIEFNGFTAAQYDAVVADMNLGGNLPPHAIFHVAGPIEGGWRVVAVWESQEAYERFAREKIMPITQKHGVTQPPKISVWPVHNMLK